jgi:gas vesicle protein
MAKQIQKAQGKKGGMNNATAGAVGAAVGGIVGAAAGIALSDREKRKMILQKMDDLKRYVTGAIDDIAQMSQESTDIISEQHKPKTKKKTTIHKQSVN